MKSHVLKRFIGLLVATTMIININIQAFAVEKDQIYSSSYNGLNFNVEYDIGESDITETTTICEDGYEPIVVKKIISSDGAIKVYQNGVYINSFYGGSYNSYLVAAQGQYTVDNSCRLGSAYVVYPCGYSQEHLYVSLNNETIDIGLSNTVSSIIATIIGAFLHPVAGAALGIITALIQRAKDQGADYIDISETKYYVHGAYVNDMNCYHALYTYYNRTSTGGKNVIDNEWVYTQVLV